MKKTQLYSYHVDHARMLPFANYSMPISYTSITEEHMSVRDGIGIFDVSHMGRFDLRGKGAEALLDYLVPSDLSPIEIGQCFYSVLLNRRGGIIDDIIVLRNGTNEFLLVVNAANTDKDFEWINGHREGKDTQLTNLTANMALIAVQGPLAQTVLQTKVESDLGALKRFRFLATQFGEIEILISRTGYTGEDGFEIFVPDSTVERPDKVMKVWSGLLDGFSGISVKPCGLGARDTLRTEAGLCLYGQDIDESTSPLEAGLSRLVAFDKPRFIGKESLLQQQEKGVPRKRIGVVMKEPGIPRAGYEILIGVTSIGRLTSAGYSPILKGGIGMGYVSSQGPEPSTEVGIRLRNKVAKAKVKEPPFYATKVYGWRREKVVNY